MKRLRLFLCFTLRGWYLLTWGVVYISLSGLLVESGATLVFPILYTITGIVCVVSSKFPRLDPLAFSLLVAVTAFRALWHIFDLATSPSLRALSIVLWAGLASTHYIVSKWPIVYETSYLNTLERQEAAYDEIKNYIDEGDNDIGQQKDPP